MCCREMRYSHRINKRNKIHSRVISSTPREMWHAPASQNKTVPSAPACNLKPSGKQLPFLPLRSKDSLAFFNPSPFFSIHLCRVYHFLFFIHLVDFHRFHALPSLHCIPSFRFICLFIIESLFCIDQPACPPMSLFNPSGKPSAIKPINAPTVRKVVVTKKIPQTLLNVPRTVKSTSSSPSKPSTALSTARRKPGSAKPSSPLRRTQKRGTSTPDARFTSDSEGDSGDDIGVEQSRKRPRAGTSSPELGRKRMVRDRRDYSQEGPKSYGFVHSADLVSGEQAKKYTPAFDVASGSIPEVMLQYPGGIQKERYVLYESTSCH